MDWDQFLGAEADRIGLSPEQRAAFLARFATQNRDAPDAKLAADLNISESAFKKRMGDVYEQFGRRYPELNQETRGKREKLRSLLQQKFEHSKQQNQSGRSGDGSQSIESWQGLNIKGGQNDIHDNPFTLQQQGIIANNQSRIEIGVVNQIHQSAPTPSPTGDGPPTNLQDRGVARDRFFGRDEVLAELHQLLQKGEHRVVIASVDGMGGVGKTELAVQYARSHFKTYRGGVVWLAGERSLSELLEFAQAQLFAGRTRLPDLGDEKVQLQYCWRNWPAQEKPPESVLLIFDDVTNYQSQVAAILPGDARFRVLITTREVLSTKQEKFPRVERLELKVLTPGAALQLLESIVGAERIAAERETAQALCEWLGFLPLGIELAGYYTVEEDCDLSELLQELEVRKRKLQHPALETPAPTMTAQLGVEAAFELSWERLDLDSRFIGAYLSLFAAAPIPWELVVSREEVSPEAYEATSTARRKLVRFSLLQKIGKLFQYHPLIKHFFSEKLEADEFIMPPSHQLTGATTEIRRLVGLGDE